MDFITDQSGRHLLQINSLVTVPDYVKQSSVDPEDVKTLEDHQFAASSAREFPIDTPGHAWLSYAYVKSAGVKDTLIEGKINRAGALFEIEKDFEQIDAAFSGTTKSASLTAEDYALTIDLGLGDPNSNIPMVKRGGQKHYYPLHTVNCVIDSARQLADHKNQLPRDLFTEAAREIVKAAAQKCIPDRELPRVVRAYGEERWPDLSYVKWAAEKRTKATGDTIYTDIADSALAHQTEDYSKYASLWCDADNQNNLPADSVDNLDGFAVFNSGELKSAHTDRINGWCLVAGSPVPVTALRALEEDQVRKWMTKVAGDAVLEVVKKASQLDGPDLTNLLGTLSETAQKGMLRMLAQ